MVYLRAIYDPIRHQLHPDRPPGQLFPLISLSELQAAGPGHLERLRTELFREAATLAMLAATALACSRNPRQWLAAFLIAFGIWDISFYAGLKILIDWPLSLLTWDILFLLPVPWVGPVLAPVLVSISMIGAGLLVFHRDLSGNLRPFRWFHWGLVYLGGFIVVLAFTWDFRNTAAGGLPNPFHWALFFAGEAAGLSGCALALRVKSI
ncbi:MAG: hypothetical protein M3Z23_07000 [Acidobacteriota bacterium]|nr:hypothetical protein [Acidobacteriota bacterium]